MAANGCLSTLAIATVLVVAVLVLLAVVDVVGQITIVIGIKVGQFLFLLLRFVSMFDAILFERGGHHHIVLLRLQLASGHLFSVVWAKNKLVSTSTKFPNDVVNNNTYLMMLSYSLSFPFDSLKRLYITEASTLAGENVFGSLSKEMTLRRMVLFEGDVSWLVGW